MRSITRRSGVRRNSAERLQAAALSALEQLESRRLLAIVQPAGQDYVAFEAEHPEAVITDLDGDGFTWGRISGVNANGLTTAPSGGAAIQAYRNAAETTINEGQISYPVQLTTAGPYYFYARVKYSASGADNSVFVPPNNGPINAEPSPQWDNLAEAQGDYHWNLTDNQQVQFSYTNPTPGAPTTFKLNIREANYIIDRIVLSQRQLTADELNAITPQTVRVVAAPHPSVTGVVLNYDAVAGSTGYNILRGTSATGPFAPVTGGQNITDLTFTDNTIPTSAVGQRFFYVVEAITPTGNVQSAPVSFVAGSGLLATHYETRFFADNPDNDTDPHVRTDNTLDENWGEGGPDFLAPDPSDVDPDNTWSIIFNGRIRPTNTGTYTFYTGSDDGIDIQIVDPDTGQVLLEGPPGGINLLRGIVYPYQETVGTVNLQADKFYNFRVRWSESGGGAAWRVAWAGPNTPFQPIPNDVLFRPDTTIAPISPSNLTARPRNNGAFLTWTDRSNNETAFLVERKIGDGAFGQIASVAADTTSYTDTTGVANGQTVTYRVRAANGALNSPFSNEATVRIGGSGGTGLIATHYETRFFEDNPDNPADPYVRNDNTLDENWGDLGPDFLQPDPSSPDPDDTWSIVFSGQIEAEFSEQYTFYTGSDDGIELTIVDPTTGDVLVHGPPNGIQFLRGIAYPYQDVVGSAALVAGRRYDIQVRWSENGGGAAWRVAWSSPSIPVEPIPDLQLFESAPGGTVRPARNLSADVICDDRITVRWVDTSLVETGSVLQRATAAGGPWTDVATLGPNANTVVTDSGPFTVNTDYFYRVVTNGPGGPVNSPVLVARTYDGATESRTDMTLNGTSRFVSVPTTVDPDGQALRLTDNVNDQTGTAFLTYARELDRDFTTAFNFYMPERSGNPADGITLTFQGVNPNQVGGGGGSLGYVGIPNSLALKFDIYNNINEVGIYRNGEGVADDGVNVGMDLRNGNVYRATVTVDADSVDSNGDGQVTAADVNDAIVVRIENLTNPSQTPFEQRLEADHLSNPFNISEDLGGDCGFIGFTGATGGENAEQVILDWTIGTQELPLTGSTTTPVPVTGVFVSGTGWSADFLAELAEENLGGPLGYRIQPGAQGEDELPWSNINKVSFQFGGTGPVTVAQDDLAWVSGRNIPYAATTFAYDPATRVATWTFNRSFADFTSTNRQTADKINFALDGDAGGA
ncbi:MAG TPA: PA14 domain-containing protein, partial [Tepidisphaeraceae bacterium]|nr:PA14 domain-containing protein [Tepidisphaeraceae bacterium]